MARSNVAKSIYTALALALLAAACLSVFDTVEVTSTSISLFVVITRNGQEVPPDQIRRVGYVFSGGLPRAVPDMKPDTLRDSRVMDGSDDTGRHWFWPVTTIIRVERSGLSRRLSWDTVKDDASVRSVLLRVEFTDGKIFSLSFLASRRSNGVLYADFSDR